MERKKRKKVCVVGAGFVGRTLIQILANAHLCDEILVKDTKVSATHGVSLDIMQSAILMGSNTQVKLLERLEDIQECAALFFCAGSPRLPGMTRDDLLLANAEVVSSVLGEIKPHILDCVVVMVSNPLDAMLYVATKILDLPRSRILGMAGVLDSARMAYFITQKLGYGHGKVVAPVMGGHGDDMVPLARLANIDGVPITELLSPEDIQEIVEKTCNGGAEIVGYLKSGSAYYAPAMSVAKMANAILADTREVLPCSILLEGEYGYHDVCTGVPVLLGGSGVEKIFEIQLLDSEKALFERSIQSVARLIDTLKANHVV